MKKDYKNFLRYLQISIMVTLIDIIISYLFENFILPNLLGLNTKILIANTLGIIVGFIIQFLLVVKHVYNQKDMKTFAKFFSTFILGLFLQNLIVVLSRNSLFNGLSTTLAFITSKTLSISIPFFFIYYLRKRWIGEINNKPKKGDVTC